MTQSPWESWFDQGMALQDNGQHAEALAYFQKAIDGKPDFIPAWVYKGIALEQLGKYEEAISCYEAAIKINPDVADLWYNKGAILCNLHRYEDALICFDKVLEIDPDNALCRTARVLTLATIANPIKQPKHRESEWERKPLEAAAAIEITWRAEAMGECELELE
ncbi:MAG TPA: tetratricopeptide repeat protein [Oscillatoriaceae cyanobacterium M33_DOE_052]|uniref:Tetratricopeptide repeat protein n=1 Tax=Planktothricoides sp. SpSt-374 TaxID=2282167 RepID=A0A7C3VN35_9CYAN|nr:tetratricopeptide repeat protein [Oscillatoriaceae cyanobacterium M33_DOE_052]